MSSIGGPNSIRDGLVLHLDAGNSKSYISGNTTWADLSDFSNNATLVGPSFHGNNNGSIAFNGINNYVSLADSVPTSLRIGQSDFTIDFWVYPNSTSAYSICGNLNDGNGDGSYWVLINSTYTGLQTVQFGSFGNSEYKFGSTSLPTNIWSNIILSRIGTSMVCYINGVAYASPITVNNFTGNFSLPYLLGISKYHSLYTSYPLNGRLSILRIYKDKGFSASEVLQNYNASKSRFGL